MIEKKAVKEHSEQYIRRLLKDRPSALGLVFRPEFYDKFIEITHLWCNKIDLHFAVKKNFRVSKAQYHRFIEDRSEYYLFQVFKKVGEMPTTSMMAAQNEK